MAPQKSELAAKSRPHEADELPEGWTSLTLADVVEPGALIQYGILQPGPDTPGGVPYIRPTEIRDDQIDEKNLRRTTRQISNSYCRSSLEPGDVVLSIVGSIGKVAIVPPGLKGANITQSSARLRPRRGLVTTEFLAAFLRSPFARRQFDSVELGTGVPRLNIGDIRQFTMPIPPAVEQRRIAEKLDALLARVRATRDRLARVPAILKRFRQSVLAAAEAGRLTEDWRGASDIVHGTKRDGARPKIPDVESSSVNENLQDLPKTWTSAQVRQLATVVRGASPRPAGDPRFFGGSTPWITVGALTKDESPYLREVKESLTDAGRAASRFIKVGTLLLTNSGVTLGVPKITLIAGCINDGSVALLDVKCDQLFLYYILKGRTDVLRRINQGAAQPNLNTTIVKSIWIPIPPAHEQIEIVRRVEALFKLADAIEARVAAATARADRLTQSILSRAFLGELVPQDPNDEPASTLLHRIRAEHEQLTPIDQATRRGTR